MEWGAHEAFLHEVVETTGEAPKALINRPTVDPAVEHVWHAFWALSGDRPLGAMGGCGSIPFLAIDAYATRFGIASGDDFQNFYALIKRLDAAFLEIVAAKAAESTPT